MIRFFLFVLVLGGGLTQAGLPPGGAQAQAQTQVDPQLRQQWEAFKGAFITLDGRIIDPQNDDISHSEGQGYGLLVAQAVGDRETFDLVLDWSNNNLGRGLRAWSWGHRQKDGKDDWGVLDENNATDGDILHAWALFLAGKKWQDSNYTIQANFILSEIRKNLIKKGLLLPGKFGFVGPDGIKINLSYYIFPAFQEFSRQDAANKKIWDHLYHDGTALLYRSLVPGVRLPPDWIMVSSSGKIHPVGNPRPLFGYEAIRIPLYLAWENDPKRLDFFRGFVKETAHVRRVPSFVYLDDGTFSLDEAGAGRSAIVARAARDLGLTKQMVLLQQQSDRLFETREENYYESILALLARLF